MHYTVHLLTELGARLMSLALDVNLGLLTQHNHQKQVRSTSRKVSPLLRGLFVTSIQPSILKILVLVNQSPR